MNTRRIKKQIKISTIVKLKKNKKNVKLLKFILIIHFKINYIL